MTRRRASGVAAAGFALAAAAVLAGASAAFAHDSLVDANPAEDATVTTLSQVSLRFSGDLLGADTGADLAQVTGPDGRHYETACASVAETDLTVPVALGGAGTYEVAWRIVSSDGHPVSGSYDFTYAPTADQPAAAGAAASPCATIDADEAKATGSGGSAQPATNDDGLILGLALGGAAVLVTGGAVGLILARSRRT